MKLDDIDRLIADLADACCADEHACSLMADASAVLGRLRLQVRTSEAIQLVLNQAQAVCEHPHPTATNMISRLRRRSYAMQQAAYECMAAHKASEMPEPRETPEGMVHRLMIECAYTRRPCDIVRHWANAIRKDRLDTEIRK